MGMVYGSLAYDVSGRKKKSMRRKNVSRKIRTIRLDNRHYRRGSAEEYPSVPDTVGVAPRVESPRYTGTLVKGIGTMHKSNAVPIIDEEQMKDIARMRR